MIHENEGMFLDEHSASSYQAVAGRTYSPPARAESDKTTTWGLECSYGSLAYRSAVSPLGCHNPVETPGERYHCDRCGGEYCSLHAEPVAHDCLSVLRPH